MKKGLRSRLVQYGDEEFALFLRRGFLKSAGFTDESLERPIVGMLSTASDFNPCHATAARLAQAVARGVRLAGALPFVFPTISLHEAFVFPTSMLLRNLMAMDVEEMVRALPLDAVVLIGGCDKTIPAELMGAISADMPAIVLPVGAMLAGRHEGARLGACTDCRRLWAAYRAGELDRPRSRPRPRPADADRRHLHGDGHRLDDGDHRRDARLHAARRSDRAGGVVRPPPALPRRPGGAPPRWRTAAGPSRATSSATPHCATPPSMLQATAARQTRSCISPRSPAAPVSPTTSRIRPHRPRSAGAAQPQAGGPVFHGGFPCRRRLAGAVAATADNLDLSAPTVGGETLGDVVARWPAYTDPEVIRPLDRPVCAGEAIAILGGNLAPQGAAIKLAAATGALCTFQGPAVVFDSLDDLAARIDDPNLPVTPKHCLVLRNAGPIGAPGMPEAGALPIPKKLAVAGRDRHGADFRRAHERHGVRHRRAACVARSRGRRHHRAGARRRHRHARYQPAPDRCEA